MFSSISAKVEHAEKALLALLATSVLPCLYKRKNYKEYLKDHHKIHPKYYCKGLLKNVYS